MLDTCIRMLSLLSFNKGLGVKHLIKSVQFETPEKYWSETLKTTSINLKISAITK